MTVHFLVLRFRPIASQHGWTVQRISLINGERQKPTRSGRWACVQPSSGLAVGCSALLGGTADAARICVQDWHLSR